MEERPIKYTSKVRTFLVNEYIWEKQKSEGKMVDDEIP